MDLTRVLVTDFNVDESLTFLLTVTDIVANESVDYININNIFIKNKR